MPEPGAPEPDITTIVPPGEPGKVAVVGKRYRLERRLGSGAFGEVYSARDEVLDRVVAVKRLDLGALGSLDSGRGELFLAEARTVARFDHPNVIPVYDAGIDDGRPWLAMRFVSGRSLDQILRAEGSMSVDRASALLRQAASALAHAHRRGVVHRDVKPANILIERAEDGAEHLWLGDFGISKASNPLASATTSQRIVGTPQYMSPEQVAAKKVDGRADLFSLGCVAVEMLTGRAPFQGDALASVLYAVVHRIPDFAEVERVAGPAMVHTLRRCLAKSPEDRFHSAEDLVRALSEEPVRAESRAPAFGRASTETESDWDGRHAVRTAGVVKRFGWRTPVLRGVDLLVPRGSIFALLGRNGCGKTTLIRTLLGIYRRDAGEVSILGRDPQRESAHLNARVGFVLEAPCFDEGARAAELLRLAGRLWPGWDRSFCNHLLERYGLDPDKRVRELSRGEKSKLSFVVAVGHRPELLVLDDPTIGLDAVVLDEVLQTLEELARDEATTVLLASHNYADLERVASHVAVLDQGRVVFSGDLAELKRTTREVRIVFRDEPADLEGVAGFRLLRRSGRRVSGVLLDPAAEPRLRALGVEELETDEISLREIVVALLR